MPERSQKLPQMALGVVWGSRVLTLGEKVVFYHDWALDQGGPDAAYASHESMALRLGESLTAATVSKIRQRLKRLTLHEPLRRRDARNLGWVSTLPRHCVPRTYHEIPALAAALDAHLQSLAEWRERSSPDGVGSLDSTVQIDQTAQSVGRAAALGGRGAPHFSVSQGEAQLPSDFREKGVSASAPKGREGRRRRTLDEAALPLDEDERAGMEAMIREAPPKQAELLRRIARL